MRIRNIILLCQSILAISSIKAQNTEVFPTLTTEDVPYRIPALGVASNGDLVAVADYRYSRHDIGDGRIDLHMRRSEDNGRTWLDICKEEVMRGDGKMQPGHQKAGYGDPCIVGDRKSPRMMIISCSGMPGTFQATRQQHQGTARWYSEDYGRTWSEPENIGEAIYEQLDKSPYGPIQAMFVASGKILQSRMVHKKKNYRLYCSIITRNSQGLCNFVLFSDNFGKDWAFLGGVDQCPIIGNGDEAKVEELPNGNILISSRCWGGRNFNIFHFSDIKSGEGHWATQSPSLEGNQGVASQGNACNGEILLVPAIRQSDKKKTHILLQSVPFGPGRSHVGIYFKELENEASYATPEIIAKNWQKGVEATNLGSAYSTMILQKDKTVGFLFEEETHCNTQGGGYTIVYQNYTIEQLTGNQYSYRKR